MADDGLKDDTERQEEPSDSGGTSAASEATLQEMADFLETGYWNNSTGLRHNLGSTGHDPNNGTLYYNVSGFDPLTYGGGSDNDGVSEARAELIRAAFDVYGAVLGINFVETTSRDDSVVDFFFSDNSSGAYAGSTRYSDGTIYYSYINIAAGWSGGTSTYDDYTLQTVFHEIGHALGLGHQGPYNGSASYGSNAVYELDSWQATMMSYFSQTQNTAISADSEYLQTPMAVDWLALDSIYGQFGYGVSNAFTGNTTYGFNTTISKSESEIWNEYANYANRTASTIIDAGGIDTVDFSGYSANQKIDLTVQTADQTEQDSSDIGGRKGNLTLAVGTVIENAVGGSGNDELIGNAAENVFEGGGGNDTMLGLAGNDTFHGDGGTDTVVFLQAFGSYAFSLFQDAIEVTGEGIDMVYDTVESLQFDNISYTFDEIIDLFSNDETDDPVASDDTATVTEGGSLSLDVLSNDSGADDATLSVTEVNGQDISVGSTVALASGAEVMLLANGTLDYLQNDAFVQLSAGEQNIDSFSYTVSDTNGGSDEASVSVTVEGMSDPEPDPVPSSDPIGQSGAITINQKASDQWHSISFDTAITDAVVVMGPVTNNGGDPLTTRVRNVTDTGFEFQMDEWNYLDGPHTTETIGWLAMSEGSHTLASGQTVVAGTHTVGTNLKTVSFGESLGEAVVLTEVTTYNGTDAVTTRLRNVDSSGFQVRLDEEEAQGDHGNETVSWIAVETGTASGLDVVRTPDQVNHRADTFGFNTDFDTSPVLLGDIQSIDGGDTSTLRMSSLSDSSVSLFVDEESSKDIEVRHTNETVGYVAMEEGVIYEDTFFV